jgi:hypothetical protein
VEEYDQKQGHRFHAFSPVRSVTGQIDDWFKGFHTAFHGVEPASGVACCAKDTVSFHYVEGAECRFLHEVFTSQAAYRAMPPGERSGAWPDWAEISGHSKRPEEGDGTWDLLLKKIERTPIDTKTGKCGAGGL